MVSSNNTKRFHQRERSSYQSNGGWQIDSVYQLLARVHSHLNAQSPRGTHTPLNFAFSALALLYETKRRSVGSRNAVVSVFLGALCDESYGEPLRRFGQLGASRVERNNNARSSRNDAGAMRLIGRRLANRKAHLLKMTALSCVWRHSPEPKQPHSCQTGWHVGQPT